MKKIYVTFRSITLAQRGERTLRAGGVDCALIRTPKWMETRGCCYCLRLRPETAERALGLLTGAAFIIGVYYTYVGVTGANVSIVNIIIFQLAAIVAFFSAAWPTVSAASSQSYMFTRSSPTRMCWQNW